MNKDPNMEHPLNNFDDPDNPQKQAMGGMRAQASQPMRNKRGQGSQSMGNTGTPASQSMGEQVTGNVSGQPSAAQSAASPDPFTAEEWQALQDTPLKVERAMIVVSPSGPVGLIQEAIAMGKNIQILLGQSFQNPLLAALGKQLKAYMEATKASGQDPLVGPATDEANVKNPDVVRNDALIACQRAATILKKAPQQDANAYKQFVFAAAQSVANAAREGSFLGIGGEQVSESEQALLRDIAKTLNYQPS